MRVVEKRGDIVSKEKARALDIIERSVDEAFYNKDINWNQWQRFLSLIETVDGES